MKIIRKVRFKDGNGNDYRLTMIDTGKTDRRGQTRVRYVMGRKVENQWSILFDGSDFCVSPLHADDSDESVYALLGFLTMRPGDTDQEYFEEYTPKQLEWAESHDCITLQCDVNDSENEHVNDCIELTDLD